MSSLLLQSRYFLGRQGLAFVEGAGPCLGCGETYRGKKSSVGVGPWMLHMYLLSLNGDLDNQGR